MRKKTMRKNITKAFVSFALLIGAGTVLNAQTLLRDNLAANGATNSVAFLDGSSNPGYNSLAANYVGKGIIFPSMDLTVALDGAPFDQGAVGGTSYNPNYYDGLVVYNTGTGAVTMGTSAEHVAPGFYYYSNPSATTWNTGVWTPMGGGGGGAVAVNDDTPTDSDLMINSNQEKVVRLSGTADGVTTHIDLGTSVLAANTVTTFRKAIIYDGTTGHIKLEATGDYDPATNTFVTGNNMMNILLPAATYMVELYYTE